MGNVEMKTRAEALAEEALVQGRKAEFVGESTEFGKEVNRRLTEKGISPYEQIGILRKALKSMGCRDAEFIAFDELVESIKAEIRAEQDEHQD